MPGPLTTVAEREDPFADTLGFRRGSGRRDEPVPDRALHYERDGDRETWRLWPGGPLHRDGDTPARIIRRSDGYSELSYYQHGEFHRDGDKPAYVETSTNGDFVHCYFQHGEPHRSGGPAHIETGSGERSEWYFEHGEQLSGPHISPRRTHAGVGT